MQLEYLFNDKKLIIIFLLSLVVCSFFIHGFPIYILDEAKNAEAAREMFASGNWIVPKFNTVLRTDKPPLHYFFMMLGYKLFGVNAIGARFFSSLFGALTLTVGFYFVRKQLKTRVAVWSWGILLSAVFFVQVFHQAVPDPYLIFFVSTGLFCFVDFYRERKYISLVLFYICLGLGALSKGPVAIVLPGIVVFVFLLFKKEIFSKKLFSYRPVLGLLLTFLVAAPWFIAVHKATEGAWTKGFFLDHNVNRFNTKMEGHGGIFLITWAFVILGLLPFSAFVVQGFITAWKEKMNDFILFAFITSAVFIVFFSISGTKLPNYTMPCYPFIAILIAVYLDTLLKEKTQRKWYSISLIVLIVISVAIPIGAFIAFNVENQLKPLKWQSLWLVIAPIGTIISFYFLKRKRLKNSIASLGLSWVVLGMAIFGIVYPKLLNQNPVSKSFKIIPEGATIVAYKRFDAAFPINYKRTFHVVHSKREVEKLLEVPNTYIITNERNVNAELKDVDSISILLEYKALFENHKTVILTSTKHSQGYSSFHTNSTVK